MKYSMGHLRMDPHPRKIGTHFVNVYPGEDKQKGVSSFASSDILRRIIPQWDSSILICQDPEQERYPNLIRSFLSFVRYVLPFAIT